MWQRKTQKHVGESELKKISWAAGVAGLSTAPQHGPVPASLYVLHVSSCPVLSELTLSTHILPYSLVTPLPTCFLSPLPPPIPSAFQIFTSEITCFGLLTHLPTSFWRQPPWLILALFTPLFLLTDFLPKRTALPLPPFNIFSDIILRPWGLWRWEALSICEIGHVDFVTERTPSNPSCEKMPAVRLSIFESLGGSRSQSKEASRWEMGKLLHQTSGCSQCKSLAP